jgi:uncharacterized protein YkwD
MEIGKLGHSVRRITALTLLVLLLFSAGSVGALSYYPAGPQGPIGLTQPTISQQFFLGPGESITQVEMWLNGQKVEALWDAASSSVIYAPPNPVALGPHTVLLTVRASTLGYNFAPISSNFTFTVAEGAVARPPTAGSEELQALKWVNHLRAGAALPPLTYDERLGAASAAHARYLARNPEQIEINAHREQAGRPLFIGVTAGDRARYYGFTGSTAEVINFTDEAERAVDGWMESLYHRIPLIHPDSRKVGYGLAREGDQLVNVLMTGSASGPSSGPVLWPYPNQREVPVGWSGGEVPNPFRLYPNASRPVGYTITLTYGGSVRSLTLESTSLSGPDGPVPVMQFSPVNDTHLRDTVALIPYSPLQTGTTYTVSMAGQVDLGQGPEPYARQWSFTTEQERFVELQSRTTSLLGGEVQQITLKGAGFAEGLAVFLGGLPVQQLTVQSEGSLTFTPPVGYRGEVADALVVTPKGLEIVWNGFYTGAEGFRFPESREPFAMMQVSLHGLPSPSTALLHHGTGTVLLPESVLSDLGGVVTEVLPIGRRYWRYGPRMGEYTHARVTGSVQQRPLLMGLPVQERNGVHYAPHQFFSQLTQLPLQVLSGQVQIGLTDIGAHWSRPHLLRLLRDGIVSGTGDGRFRPDETLTRAAFVKMLVGARGILPQPEANGGFSDTVSHWVAAQGYVGAAVTAGILVISEYPEAQFEPDRPITREEMAVMVTRALGQEKDAASRPPTAGGTMEIAGRTFVDAVTWSRAGYVAVAVEKGIITGYPEAEGGFSFRPERLATRAEASAMIVRTLTQ